MNAVGIDVSKGKSMVAAMRLFGEVVQYIANLRDGAWCGFKYFAFNGTEKTISVTVRSSEACTLSVSTDKTGIPIATVKILPSKEWKEYSASMAVTKRVAPLYFTCYGSTQLDFSCFEIC